MAVGLGPGLILGITLSVQGSAELGPLLGGAGVLLLGATLFGLGVWKRRVKIRRRTAQANRLREIDEELRRRSPGVELAFGLGSFRVRW